MREKSVRFTMFINDSQPKAKYVGLKGDGSVAEKV